MNSKEFDLLTKATDDLKDLAKVLEDQLREANESFKALNQAIEVLEVKIQSTQLSK